MTLYYVRLPHTCLHTDVCVVRIERSKMFYLIYFAYHKIRTTFQYGFAACAVFPFLYDVSQCVTLETVHFQISFCFLCLCYTIFTLAFNGIGTGSSSNYERNGSRKKSVCEVQTKRLLPSCQCIFTKFKKCTRFN